MNGTERVGDQIEEGLADNFLVFSTNRLSAAAKNIVRCIDRLHEEQLWRRSGDWENSVANLVLHLVGNVRQFILHAVAGDPVTRDREREFSLSLRVSRKDILELFESTMEDVYRALSLLTESDLKTITDPHTAGWGLMTKLECVYHAVGHFQLHTGQIIFFTKQLVASDLDLSIPRARS